MVNLITLFISLGSHFSTDSYHIIPYQSQCISVFDSDVKEYVHKLGEGTIPELKYWMHSKNVLCLNLRETSKANSCEEINCKSCILGIISWKYTIEESL